jgi:hypothetical protein
MDKWSAENLRGNHVVRATFLSIGLLTPNKRIVVSISSRRSCIALNTPSVPDATAYMKGRPSPTPVAPRQMALRISVPRLENVD